MPIVGKKYVFFLTHKFPLYGKQNPDLYILTGYELTNGIVSPLDAANGEHIQRQRYIKERKKLI